MSAQTRRAFLGAAGMTVATAVALALAPGARAGATGLDGGAGAAGTGRPVPPGRLACG